MFSGVKTDVRGHLIEEFGGVLRVPESGIAESTQDSPNIGFSVVDVVCSPMSLRPGICGFAQSTRATLSLEQSVPFFQSDAIRRQEFFSFLLDLGGFARRFWNTCTSQAIRNSVVIPINGFAAIDAKLKTFGCLGLGYASVNSGVLCGPLVLHAVLRAISFSIEWDRFSAPHTFQVLLGFDISQAAFFIAFSALIFSLADFATENLAGTGSTKPAQAMLALLFVNHLQFSEKEFRFKGLHSRCNPSNRLLTKRS